MLNGDVALHGVLHGAGEDFAVGNVADAFALHRADALDAEAQIGAGRSDVDGVGFLHAAFAAGAIALAIFA